jgi:hypothetical protein
MKANVTAIYNRTRPPVSDVDHHRVGAGLDLPSYSAMVLMVGLYLGDPVIVRDGEIMIDLNKALDVPPRPDEDCAQPITEDTLGELDARGWIKWTDLPTGESVPAITAAGRYWIRRYADRTVGKRYEPCIRLHPEYRKPRTT